MQQHYKKGAENMPRILGLTATLIKKNVESRNLEREIQTLEANLDSKLVQLHSLDIIKG